VQISVLLSPSQNECETNPSSDHKNAAVFANRISWRKITITSLTEVTVVNTTNVGHERKKSLFWMFRVFFKENLRYPVGIFRDPIYLILGTRFSLILGTRWLFSLILGTRFEILGTRIGSLKRLKKTCNVIKKFCMQARNRPKRFDKLKCFQDINRLRNLEAFLFIAVLLAATITFISQRTKFVVTISKKYLKRFFKRE